MATDAASLQNRVDLVLLYGRSGGCGLRGERLFDPDAEGLYLGITQLDVAGWHLLRDDLGHQQAFFDGTWCDHRAGVATFEKAFLGAEIQLALRCAAVTGNALCLQYRLHIIYERRVSRRQGDGAHQGCKKDSHAPATLSRS